MSTFFLQKSFAALGEEVIRVLEAQVLAKQREALPLLYGPDGYYESLRKLNPVTSPKQEPEFESPIFVMDSPRLGPEELDHLANFSLDTPVLFSKSKSTKKSNSKRIKSPATSSLTPSLEQKSASSLVENSLPPEPTLLPPSPLGILKTDGFSMSPGQSSPMSPWRKPQRVVAVDISTSIVSPGESSNDVNSSKFSSPSSLKATPRLSQKQRKLQKMQESSIEKLPRTVLPWKSPTADQFRPSTISLLEIQKEEIHKTITTPNVTSDWRRPGPSKISFLSIQLEQEKAIRGKSK